MERGREKSHLFSFNSLRTETEREIKERKEKKGVYVRWGQKVEKESKKKRIREGWTEG